MLNVICVKWGDRYSSKYVNRLRYMVQRNLNVEHRFLCLTEDVSGIEPDIETISIPKESVNLELWWSKLFLFRPELLPEGRYLFFDLDIIIQKNIDDIANYEAPNLCCVSRSWEPNSGLLNNSSCMLWETGMCDSIWDYFIAEPKLTMSMYTGIDNFLRGEKMSFSLFPDDWFYSYAYGDKNNSGYVKKQFIGEYMPDYKVCLMNSIYKHLQRGHSNNPYKRKEYTQYMGDYV